jgi:ABC-type branched-subunit amino acid transport system substrate-binding protein
MLKHRLATTVALSVLASGIAACGSTGAVAQSANSPAGIQTASQGSSKQAIQIYDIGPNPGAALDPTAGQAGMEAAVKAVNAAGGINGRPINVTYCNAITSSATLASQCAQSAVSNPSVVADIGHFSTYDQGDPIEQAGGLAVSGTTVSPGDNTATNFFPVDTGGFIAEGQAVGAVQLLKAKRVCYAYVDVPGVGGQATLINQWILNPRHLSLYKSIPLELTASDLSPQAAEANGCDAIVLNSSTQQSIQYTQAVRSLGNNVPIVLGPASGASALAQALGANPTNIYQAGRFYRNSPGYAAYERDMSALHFANTQFDNDNSIMTWAALKEFAAIAKSLPSVTRKAVLASYKKQSKVTMLGLTPAINFTVPQSGAGGAYPAVRNDTTALYKYKASAFHFQGNPQKPFIQVLPAGNTSIALNVAPFSAVP